MPTLQQWLLKKQRQRRYISFHETLLRDSAFPYVIYRLRYFFINFGASLGVHIIEYFLLLAIVSRTHFYTLILLRASAFIVNGAWWGMLEVLRTKIRHLQSMHDKSQIGHQVGCWLILSILISIVLVAGAICAAVIIRLENAGSNFYSIYIIAIALQLASQLIIRTLHSGIYAIARVPRPLTITLITDLLPLLALLLWPLVQAYSLPLVFLLEAFIYAAVTWHYAKRVYQFHDITIRFPTFKQFLYFLSAPPSLTLITSFLSGAMISLTSFLTSRFSAYLSPHVYSYTKGRNVFQAVAKFAAYLRQANKNSKGVFVFHTDIYHYTDSIPVHAASRLWSQIEQLLQETNGEKLSPYIYSLVADAFRPLIATEENGLYQHTIGIPTGMPLTTLAANIYLQSLDKELGAIPASFYARFGDDIIFAHQNLELFNRITAVIAAKVQELDLNLHPTKTRYLYLTRGAIKCENHPEFLPAASLTFLGMKVFINGSIELKRLMSKTLLNEIKYRLATLFSFTVDKTSHKNKDEMGKLICSAVNNMLDPNHPARIRYIKDIYLYVNSRVQLKNFDYQIALNVAQIVTGITGAKAFRHVPYKKIREQWGLNSLCYHLNKHRRE